MGGGEGEVGISKIEAIREPLACGACREDLRRWLVRDRQKPEAADCIRAIWRAAYCPECLRLSLAPLGEIGDPERAEEPNVCGRCWRILVRSMVPGYARKPGYFFKAVTWAYLCNECARIVIEHLERMG